MSLISKLSFLQGYETLLKKKPIQTKMASTFAINLVGDITCQLMMHKQDTADSRGKFSWDSIRSLRQAVIIAVGYTPYMHFYLTRVAPHIRVSPSISKSETASTALRVFIHSFILLPFNQSMYWYAQGACKNNMSHEKGFETFHTKVIKENGP